MAKSKLHQRIETIAQKNGAMCISAPMITAALLRNLVDALGLEAAGQVHYPTGHRAVVAVFKDINTEPDKILFSFTDQPTGVAVKSDSEFSFTIDLKPHNHPALTFCSIKFTAPLLEFSLHGDGDFLHLTSTTTAPTADVQPGKTREEAITATGISIEDLLRVEGSIAYASGGRIIATLFGDIPPINLKALFPAIGFSGLLNLHAVDDAILVVPERLSLMGNPGCPLGNVAAGVSLHRQQMSKSNDGSTASWSYKARLPPRSQLPAPSTADALASVYFPKPVLDLHFSRIAPAASFRDHGNGFIGYDLQATAAVRGVALAIDPVALGLRLTLQFATWGMATANIDVPCVGRVDIAQAKFQMPKENATATVVALLRLAIDNAGRLLVVSELAELDLGEAEADVQLFSKYLGMAGGDAAVKGFIIDMVLGNILAKHIHATAMDVITDTVNQHFFVLADLRSLYSYLERTPNLPSFSADNDSALMGLLYAG